MRSLRWQRLYGKDDPDIPGELADAEESARRARLALVWPYAIALHIARYLRDSVADNREISQGRTALHKIRLEQRIAELDQEIERLRRKQEGK